MNEMKGRLIIKTPMTNYRNNSSSNQLYEDINMPSHSNINCMQIDDDQVHRKFSDNFPERLLKNCTNQVLNVKKFKIISQDECKSQKKELSTDKSSNNNTNTTSANSLTNKDKIMSKLTFGNAFSLSSKHLMNSNPISGLIIDRSGLKSNPSPGFKKNNNNQIPIFEANQPQINININDLNINNFHLCSQKLKKKKSLDYASIFPYVNSSQSANNHPGNSISTNQNHPILIKNIDINSVKLLPSALPCQKFTDLKSYCSMPKGSHPMNRAREELKTRGSNLISRESDEFMIQTPNGPVSHKTVKQAPNEIETILEGNNDSFINELADLLNNVDAKANKQEKQMESGHEACERQVIVGEEVPDPRINFEQLQMLNSKRPQTSYGGLSARQKSLQNSLRKKSSIE